MTLGLSKDIQCHDHTFSLLANHQSRHQATGKLGCQPGDSRVTFNLPQGFVKVVWVCTGEHTHFVTLQGLFLFLFLEM